MNLLALAAADSKIILEDSAAGFATDITVTPPDGDPVVLRGWANDRAQMIDPETGQAISGREASIALSLSTLATAGLDVPKGEADATQHPWVVSFADLHGKVRTFRVLEANPDQIGDIVTCTLEVYRR